jgi:hypothetical protein
MFASANPSDGSGSEQPLDAIDQGRLWIARALVRLGHPRLIDRDLDQDVLGPAPSGRLGTILEPLRLRRDALKYQIPAVITLAAIYFVVSVVLGLGADAGHLAPLGVVAGGLLLPLLGTIDDLEDAAGALVVALLIVWITALVILLIHDPKSVSYAYVLPAIVVLALVSLLPTRFPLRDVYDVVLSFGGAVRSAPLLGPVLLGIFAIALFDADLWRAAFELNGGRIAEVLALTLGTLVLVVRARLRSQLEAVLLERTEFLDRSRDERSSRMRREIRLADGEVTPAVIEECAAAVCGDYWPERPADRVPEFKQSEGKTLLAPVTMRLLLTAVLVGSIVLAYVYVLSWVAVPTDVAKDWISRGSPVAHVGGAHFRVAALLSCIATAAFLGSAALDERVGGPLTNAILGEPATRFLVLALPYGSMVEEARGSAAPGM